MRSLTWSVAVLCLGVGLAHGLDAPILGSQFLVKDPKPGVDASKRKVVAKAKEKASADVLMGSPDLLGATVTVFVSGGTSASQSFVLPPGTDPATGKPFWSASATGFKYKDPKGAAGAVRQAEIKKTASGTFQIKLVAVGKNGPLTLMPPNPGTSACVRLDLDGGAIRYHVLLPPAPGATVKKNDAETFLIKEATSEGLCPVPAAVCGDGIVDPGEICDGSPFCDDCFLDMPACCGAPGVCIDAPGYSLMSLIFQHCMFNLPGWNQTMAGGVCGPDGSCSVQPIAPLSVCCQRDGSCEDATVSDTVELYNFHAACQGPQTGITRLEAMCAAGTCIQE